MLLGAGALIGFILLYLVVAWLAKPLRQIVATVDALASGRTDQPPHDEARYQEAARLSAALVRLRTFSFRPYQPPPVEKKKTSTPAA